jgi:hypothetical protein
MASRNATELAKELLALKPSAGHSAVEGIMAGGCGQYGGGFDSVKDFYGKHRTPVMAIGAVVGVALIGWAGYAIYKKYIWERPDYIPNAHNAQRDQQ